MGSKRGNRGIGDHRGSSGPCGPGVGGLHPNELRQGFDREDGEWDLQPCGCALAAAVVYGVQRVPRRNIHFFVEEHTLTTLGSDPFGCEAAMEAGRPADSEADGSISLGDGRWERRLNGTIAALPAEFLESLESRNEKKMMDCVNRNFDLRREIWGDEALGGENGANLQMIRVAEGVC